MKFLEPPPSTANIANLQDFFQWKKDKERVSPAGDIPTLPAMGSGTVRHFHKKQAGNDKNH
jgi:hypothetical protein